MNNENKGIHATGVSSRVWIALAALCVANVVAHLIVMPSLPAQIPTHWGANGAVDGWGPSWMASALGALPLVVLAMFYVVPRIDPKGEAYRTSGKFYQGFVIAFTLFMCAISWLGELTVWGVLPAVGTVNLLVSGAIGLLFARKAELHTGHQNTLGACRPRELATYAAFWRCLLYGAGCWPDRDGRGRQRAVERSRRRGDCGSGVWFSRSCLRLFVSAVAQIAASRSLRLRKTSVRSS